MISLDKTECHEWKDLKWAVKFGFAVILSYFCIYFLYYHQILITSPYPLEYREGCIPQTTALMLRGGNPYDLKYQPEHMNGYGIFYHAVVYPFAKWLGPTLTLHRAVSGFFIVASCILLFFVMRFRGISRALSAAGALLLYASLLYWVTPIARPDGLGVFLFLATLFIPMFLRFSTGSLVASSVLGICALYTKLYFVLGIPYLTCYLFLFISKKKGLWYGGFSLAAFVLTARIADRLFECYLSNVFFASLNSRVQQNWGYAHLQFRFFAEYYAWILGAWALVFLVFLARNFSEFKKRLSSLRELPRLSFSFVRMDAPLIQKRMDFVSFCLLCSLGVIYFKLGKYHGTWMSYYFQILSPLLLVSIFSAMRKPNGWVLVFIPLILLNLRDASASKYLPRKNFDMSGWGKIRDLVSSHDHIFNSPAIVSVLLEQNKKVYDNGHSEYFIDGALRKSFWGQMLPHDRRITQRTREFLGAIQTAVSRKDFDLVIVTKNQSPFLSPEMLEKYYRHSGAITVLMPHTFEQWELDVWAPK